MFSKKLFLNVLNVFAVLFLLSPCYAQFIAFCKYEGVEIPYRLIFHDTIIEKGRYNLEALKSRTGPDYYLRIKKGGKILCLIEGERLEYQNQGPLGLTDPTIPEQCTLKMSKNTEEKVFYLIIQSGKRNGMFPFLWLKFKVKYEEEKTNY